MKDVDDVKSTEKLSVLQEDLTEANRELESNRQELERKNNIITDLKESTEKLITLITQSVRSRMFTQSCNRQGMNSSFKKYTLIGEPL